MFDDDGDIDDNGIPDSIQRDPVVERQAVVFGEPADEGLPGITAPIEATAEAAGEPLPEAPVAPTPPPADADEAAHLDYQRAMQRYQQLMETMSNLQQMHHDTAKGIIQNLRG